MAKTLKDKLFVMIGENGLLYILLALEEIYSRKAHDHEVAGNDEKALQCRKISHLMLDVNAETCHWKV